MSGPMAISQTKAEACLENCGNYRDRCEATSFSRNAPEGATSIATRDPPLMSYNFLNGAGIVTRPRVENFTW